MAVPTTAAAADEEFHDDIIYPATIPFVLVHVACLGALWSGVTAEALALCAALGRYRDAFRPLAQAVVDAEPERFAEVDADGLSAVVAGFIEGCALQVVMDPAGFDVNAYMRTVQTLVSDPLSLRLAAARHVRG